MYLDSCLHCGASHPEITSYIGQPLRHRIKCTECPHVIECFSSSIHHARDAWNRRSDASLADAQAEIARLRGALEDQSDTIRACFKAVGYTEEYALQWPKEKASVTFKRWFDEQVSTK